MDPNIDIRQDGVEVKGRVTDAAKLAAYFRDLSFFVLPSLLEPVGTVFVDAFAFKNPCIGTDICAMSEIIDEGNGGYLVPLNDSKALAASMIMILKDDT